MVNEELKRGEVFSCQYVELGAHVHIKNVCVGEASDETTCSFEVFSWGVEIGLEKVLSESKDK